MGADLTIVNNGNNNLGLAITTCQFLQTVGGKDIQDTTRRVLSRIMSKKLAMLYNWSVAVRKNPFSKNATQQEIESVVKVWLRNASDRDGGRSRKKNATITA
ncbi:hypothetical protein RN001_003442 [Aquatica leii]|uniref:Uncharacterized protein n=1 Tax=Aquatica leii TaxID=1421715 RepID=A0AAN7PNP4_9COLE|nr:hypothetical protein RN001_003442 [Aquatica leii]